MLSLHPRIACLVFCAFDVSVRWVDEGLITNIHKSSLRMACVPYDTSMLWEVATVQLRFCKHCGHQCVDILILRLQLSPIGYIIWWNMCFIRLIKSFNRRLCNVFDGFVWRVLSRCLPFWGYSSACFGDARETYAQHSKHKRGPLSPFLWYGVR